MGFNSAPWAGKKIREAGKIKDPEKAETVARAEKPYRDAARLSGVTPELKKSFDSLAVQEGDKTQRDIESKEVNAILDSLELELEQVTDLASLEIVTRKFYDIRREAPYTIFYYAKKLEEKVADMLKSATFSSDRKSTRLNSSHM